MSSAGCNVMVSACIRDADRDSILQPFTIHEITESTLTFKDLFKRVRVEICNDWQLSKISVGQSGQMSIVNQGMDVKQAVTSFGNLIEFNVTRQKDYVSKWCDNGETLINQSILMVGDRLQVEGEGFALLGGASLYTHWAVVSEISENPKLIHFAEPAESSGSNSGSSSKSSSSSPLGLLGGRKKADILVGEIKRYGRKIRVNNGKDTVLGVLSKDRIAENIQKCLEDPASLGEYNVVFNNCEGLANFIRHGRNRSDQVVIAAKTAMNITATATLCTIS